MSLNSDDRLHLLLHSLPHALAFHQVVLDSEGHPVDSVFLDVNPAFETMTGRSRQDIIGRRATAVYAGAEESCHDWVGTYRHMMKTGGVVQLKQYFEHTERWYDVTTCSDRPGFFVALFRDITAEKRAREGLCATLNSIADGVIATDVFGQITRMNPSAERLTGWPLTEAAGKSVFDVVDLADPQTGEQVPNPVQEVLRSQKPGKTADHTLLINRDGTRHHISHSAVPILGDGGDLSGSVMVFSDDTSAYLAEQSLRQSEERYRALVENAPAGIARFDEDLRRVYVNPEIVRIADELGLPAEHYIGETSREAGMPEDVVDAWESALRSVFATGTSQTVDINYDTPRGTRYYRSNLAPEFSSDGTVSTVISITRDVTDMHKATQALEESEARYRGIVEDTPMLICSFLPGGEITFVNRSYCESFGMTQEQLVGTSFLPLIPEAERETVRRTFSSLTVESPTVTYEHQVVAPGGQLRWQRWTDRALFNAQGQVACYHATGQDITERKRAEQALHQSEQYNRSIVEVMPDIVIRTNRNGEYLDIAASCEDRLVRPREELLGKRVGDVLPEDASAHILECIGKALDSRVLQTVEYPCDMPAPGGTLWFEARVVPLHDEEALALIRDITDSKRAERALRDSEERLNTLLSQTPAVVYSYEMTNEAPDITYLSCNVRNVLGFDPQDFVGNVRLWEECLHPDDVQMVMQALPRLIQEGTLSHEYRFKDSEGEYHWLRDEQRLVVHEDGTQEVIGAWWDVTERKQAEEKLRYISFHDSLTGLYSRHYLEAEMDRLDTARQLPLSIIMADLDGLKVVNDAYGHSTGDEMLRRAAGILRESCRKEDVIGRWGGDEFVVLLPETTEEAARAICRRVSDNCRDATIEDVPISMSIGLAIRTRTAQVLATLVREAEDDMYRQKTTARRSHRRAVLNALLKALEAKSFETERHVQNMERLALTAGERMGLAESELSRLRLLIALHDIGKITIPDEVLAKTGPLTPEEWTIVKRHPATGHRIALATDEFAHVAEDILAHHERWDGSGYPRRLKGDGIPLLARIAAIADAYEVMTNGRPYKEALSQTEAVAELNRCAGTQFDPELVDVFLSALQEQG